MDSSLPTERKIDLLLEGATSRWLTLRLPALKRLAGLDSERFHRELIRTLQRLPTTRAGQFRDGPEPQVADLVLLTEDPHAWDVLRRVAKRSDLWLRMELLDRAGASRASSRVKQRRLTFLAAFLDDEMTRNVRRPPVIGGGPYAGSDFRLIEVRNFAAMKAAAILQLAERPRPDWSDAQWSDFREAVRTAIVRGTSAAARQDLEANPRSSRAWA